MDKKRIVKNIIFIATVPAVVAIGYYGYKAFKHYKNKKAGENEEGNGEIEEKSEIEGKLEEKKEIKEETKVIPISKGMNKDKKTDINNVKEA
jgi:uncharacterized membrane protein YebE (DUF533 family)